MEGEERRPEEVGIRQKKFLTAAQPEAPRTRGAFSRRRVTRHPLSPVIILPLAEHTRHLPGAHMHGYTTTHCLRRLDLLSSAARIGSSKHGQLKQNGKKKQKNTGCEKKECIFHLTVKILSDIRGMVCNESVVDCN